MLLCNVQVAVPVIQSATANIQIGLIRRRDRARNHACLSVSLDAGMSETVPSPIGLYVNSVRSYSSCSFIITVQAIHSLRSFLSCVLMLRKTFVTRNLVRDKHNSDVRSRCGPGNAHFICNTPGVATCGFYVFLLLTN